MPILEDHFYHKTITLICGVFGSVFNEIKIKRDDGKVIKVPIAYEIKQKYDVRNTQNPDPNAVRYKMQLPRMGFKLLSMQKDISRSLNRMHPIYERGVDRETATGIKQQYNRVPYNFQFMLNVKTKTLDDMLQIIEQIVVYFDPTVRVNVTDNPDLNFDSSFTIKMLDSTLEDLTEGMFEQEQSLETTLTFELEGWLYKPTSEIGIIKTITINYHDLNNFEFLESDEVS